MRFGSTAQVLLKCKLKYYRISECGAGGRMGDRHDAWERMCGRRRAAGG